MCRYTPDIASANNVVGATGLEPPVVTSGPTGTLQIPVTPTGAVSGAVSPELADLAAALRQLSPEARARLARLLDQ